MSRSDMAELRESLVDRVQLVPRVFRVDRGEDCGDLRFIYVADPTPSQRNAYPCDEGVWIPNGWQPTFIEIDGVRFRIVKVEDKAA